LPTDFQFTGQRAEGFGLCDYHARYYDPLLGRFVSADTLVPDLASPSDFNRYAYVRGNSLRYVDPLGIVLPGTVSVEEEKMRYGTQELPFRNSCWRLVLISTTKKTLITLSPSTYLTLKI